VIEDPNEESDYLHGVDRRIFRWVGYAVAACVAVGVGAFVLLRVM
jgi:hypothetical protein